MSNSEEKVDVVVEELKDTTSNPETTTDPVKVTETTTPVTVADRVVGIPLSLVVRCTNLIENLSVRGSFRASEMSEVGALYNSLAKLVNTAANQIRAEQVLPKESEEASEEASEAAPVEASESK